LAIVLISVSVSRLAEGLDLPPWAELGLKAYRAGNPGSRSAQALKLHDIGTMFGHATGIALKPS
jgi:hypothetical protein